MDDQKLIKAAKQQLMHKLGDRLNELPVYIDGLRSQKHAETVLRKLGDKAPFVYVWNEKSTPMGPSFSISLNGAVVGAALEEFVDRHDLLFDVVRDAVMAELHEASKDAIMDTCNAARAGPSKCFKTIKIKRGFRQ